MFHFFGRAGRPEAAHYPNPQTIKPSNYQTIKLSSYRTVITAPAFTRPVVCAPFSANDVPALG